MKIEVEVNDVLVAALGEEMVKDYLRLKAEELGKKWQVDAHPADLPEDTNKEAIQKAWDQFNKRGMSC